jgi:alcohol dehydrogenase
VAEERRLVGSYMGSAVPRRDIPRLMNLHAAGLLPVEALQSGRFRLDTINAGFDALSDGQPGRQLLVFDERR